MNKPLQRELFAQRPVRSDFARRRSGSDGGGPGFNPRKLLFVGLLIAVAIGGGYAVNALMSGSSDKLEEIPTVQAEMPIKERPDQPGGIDIPHQDVAVFEKLDNNNAAPPQAADNGVEHLLPAPEVPKPAPAPAPAVTPPQGEEAAMEAESVTPVPEPVQAPVQEALPPAVTSAEDVPEQPVAATPEPAKAEPAKAVEKKAEPKAAPVEKVKKTEPVKAAVKTEVSKNGESQKADAAMARLPKELFTKEDYSPEKVATTAKPAATTAATSSVSETASTGGRQVAVQLASVTDEAAAKKMLATLQSRYAAILGSMTLRVERADLGSKGTYYRIKSSSVSESKAKAICTDITQQKKGNCIVVK